MQFLFVMVIQALGEWLVGADFFFGMGWATISLLLQTCRSKFCFGCVLIILIEVSFLGESV